MPVGDASLECARRLAVIAQSWIMQAASPARGRTTGVNGQPLASKRSMRAAGGPLVQ
jgi:hypothetical protein